jgi:hypothetical protein
VAVAVLNDAGVKAAWLGVGLATIQHDTQLHGTSWYNEGHALGATAAVCRIYPKKRLHCSCIMLPLCCHSPTTVYLCFFAQGAGTLCVVDMWVAYDTVHTTVKCDISRMVPCTCAFLYHRVRTTVLGSRNQLCLNEKVLKLPGQAGNFTCRALVQHKQCRWWVDGLGVALRLLWLM